MHSLAEAALGKMQLMDPQSLANMAWACARCCYNDKKLIKSMSSQALDTIQEFAEQNLTNTAWALASLAINDSKPLMDAIAGASMMRIS